jgi:hypothetical protein
MEFHLSAQSKNTGPATSCVGASPRELNIGFVVRQAMPRLSLVRSLPADIGGSKRVCRTVGASYASHFCRRCMGAHGWSQRMTAATRPAGQVLCADTPVPKRKLKVGINLSANQPTVLNLPIWVVVCILRSECYRTNFLRSAEKT